MNFINKILEKRWRKKLNFYYEQAKFYYSKYKFKKKFVDTYRNLDSFWYRFESDLNDAKIEKEEALKQYRYWNEKFKKMKKKLKNLY